MSLRQVKPLIVIEHLEDSLNRWLIAEYQHAASIARERLVLTNLPTVDICEKIGLGVDHCFRESIVELRGVLYSSTEKLIILDPAAKRQLDPSEAKNADAIVVGGILGDYPPRGRTFKLLTSKLYPHVVVRNIGKEQFAIDGAVFVALEILKGRSLKDIEIVKNLNINIDLGGLIVEITLPYAYPLKNGRPFISSDILKILREGGYEYYKAMSRDSQ